MTSTLLEEGNRFIPADGEWVGLEGAVGSVTVKVVPSPSIDSTSTVPFIRCRRCFTMLNPRPVPCLGLVSEVSACLKGWNSAPRNDLGIPQPESLTLIIACSGETIETDTPIYPASQNFCAFDNS